MTEALRFEWVRISTLRSTYWLIAGALALNAAVALLVTLTTRDGTHDYTRVGVVVTGGGPFTGVPFVAVFLAVAGILATGHEYRYGTIQPTLTTVPRRSTMLAAKLAVVAALGLVVSVVSLLVDVVIALLVWGEVPGLTAQPLAGVLPGYVVLVLLWTVLGAALAQLFRGVPAALVVILVVPLIVEQLIYNLSYADAFRWLTPAVKFLPFMAGQQLIGLGGAPEFLARWASGGVFAVFVAIILSTAWTLFTRRDA